MAACLSASIAKGYVAGLADCPWFLHTLQQPAGEQHPQASLGGAAAASAAGGPGRSVAQSNTAFSKLRSDAASGLDLACRILLLDETRVVMQGVALLSQAVADEHGRTVTVLKTRGGCVEWSVEMACAERLEHLNGVLDLLVDPSLLIKLGLVSPMGDGSSEFGDAAWQRVLDTWFVYVRELLNCEVEFLRTYCEDLPNVFASLVATDKKKRAQGVKWLRSVWERLTTAEKEAKNDQWLQTFIEDLSWPDNTWVREVFIGLTEMADGDDQLPPPLDKEVLDRCKGPLDHQASGGPLPPFAGRIKAFQDWYLRPQCAMVGIPDQHDLRRS